MMAGIASALLVAWLLLGEPLLGRRSHRRMLAALDAGRDRARLYFYRSWTWQAWLLACLTLVVAWANHWSLASLGLRLPHALGSVPIGFIAGIAAALLAGALFGLLLARRQKSADNTLRQQPIAGGDKVLRMLPRGGTERRSFAVLAITAGVTEELIWRGFGVAALRCVWPLLPLLPTIIVLAVAFGWAHFYQGAGGMLVTGLIGAVMVWLYLASGSLLLPMFLHALLDLRALLLPLPAEPAIDPTHIPSDRERSSFTEKHP
ncbi:MAG TPA: CPBP family intramembrane glutamic endopeptidase [Rhodanobacter sp.]